MYQNPWLVHSGWLMSNIKCLLSLTPARSVSSCFAHVKGTHTCFDFDPVNQNCSGGRSWSRFGQQRDVSQVSSEPHICVDEPVFSVVPLAGPGAAAHAGSAGAGQSWTQHAAFQNVSPWSLVRIEMPLQLSLQYQDTCTGIFLAVLSMVFMWHSAPQEMSEQKRTQCHPIFTLLYLCLLPATYPWGRVDHRATNLAEQLLLQGDG